MLPLTGAGHTAAVVVVHVPKPRNHQQQQQQRRWWLCPARLAGRTPAWGQLGCARGRLVLRPGSVGVAALRAACQRPAASTATNDKSSQVRRTNTVTCCCCWQQIPVLLVGGKAGRMAAWSIGLCSHTATTSLSPACGGCLDKR